MEMILVLLNKKLCTQSLILNKFYDKSISKKNTQPIPVKKKKKSSMNVHFSPYIFLKKLFSF
jgi:hypothetical protein